MKTKTILTAGCLILATVCTQAQQTTEPKREKAIVETQGDSIIILRGKGRHAHQALRTTDRGR